VDLLDQEMVNPSESVRSEGSKACPVKDRARKHIIREMRAQRRNKKEIDRARRHTQWIWLESVLIRKEIGIYNTLSDG